MSAHSTNVRRASDSVGTDAPDTLRGWTREEIETILDECDEEEIDPASLISHEQLMRELKEIIDGAYH